MLPQLVLSGTSLALLTGWISEQGYVFPAAQLLAFSKFAVVQALLFATRGRSGSKEKPPTRRGRRLLVAISCLDVVSYALYCTGFALCGTGLAVGMFAAASQTATAALVVLVNAGLLIRMLAPMPKGMAKAAAAEAPAVLGNLSKEQALGGAALLTASLGYAMLGLVYELMLKTETPPPSHTQAMQYVSCIGLAATSAYQLLFTVPRWDALVTAPMVARGKAPVLAVMELTASGLVFFWHSFNMTRVLRSHGAVAVGLINAFRGAMVSLLSGMAFCTPDRPQQCNTPWTVASALVITIGAAAWVSGPKPAAAHEDKDEGKKEA